MRNPKESQRELIFFSYEISNYELKTCGQSHFTFSNINITLMMNIIMAYTCCGW